MLDGGIAHGGVTFHIRESHTAEALAKTVGNGSDHRAAGPNQVQQVKRNADDHTLPGRNGAIFDDPMQSLELGGVRNVRFQSSDSLSCHFRRFHGTGRSRQLFCRMQS